MLRKNFPYRKQKRQEEAKIRQEEADKRKEKTEKLGTSVKDDNS